jgi:hypothetical protein
VMDHLGGDRRHPGTKQLIHILTLRVGK